MIGEMAMGQVGKKYVQKRRLGSEGPRSRNQKKREDEKQERERADEQQSRRAEYIRMKQHRIIEGKDEGKAKMRRGDERRGREGKEMFGRSNENRG